MSKMARIVQKQNEVGGFGPLCRLFVDKVPVPVRADSLASLAALTGAGQGWPQHEKRAGRFHLAGTLASKRSILINSDLKNQM